MVNPKFQHYSFGDFDKYNCLKISIGFYGVLIFVLRAYVVWAMSVTNFKDRVGFLQWVFPDPKLFYLTLASGAIGLFLLFVMALRKPDAPAWVQRSWKKARMLVVVALMFDMAVSLLGYFMLELVSVNWLVAQLAISALLMSFCLFNKRFLINVEEFPEKIEE